MKDTIESLLKIVFKFDLEFFFFILRLYDNLKLSFVRFRPTFFYLELVEISVFYNN